MDKKALIVPAIIVVALLLASRTKGSPAGGSLNLLDLADRYGTDAINRLNSIYYELVARGYSTEQCLWMLSQILFETGLFTSDANIPLMNRNNYAGLTTTGGGYASYNSISDFVDAYEGFLTKNNDPIDASSLADFNNRLVANHYYTENPTVYYNGLLNYYNLLTSTQ